jgi:hypothetical protein
MQFSRCAFSCTTRASLTLRCSSMSCGMSRALCPLDLTSAQATSSAWLPTPMLTGLVVQTLSTLHLATVSSSATT